MRRLGPIFLALCLLLASAPVGVGAQTPNKLYPETGFAVSDTPQARFLTEFGRLGGVDALGYPISRPFEWQGFTYQVFQRAALQWRPELNAAYLANALDWLSDAGKEPYLAALGIPGPLRDAGGAWEKVVAERESWMTEPAIAGAYRAGGGSERFGLPSSRPQRSGPFVVQRFQRYLFQLWVEDVPNMPAKGSVVGVLVGDLLLKTGLVPSSRVFLGYYVPYDATSFASLKAAIGSLDYVAPHVASFDGAGNLVTQDASAVVALAHASGVRALLSVATSSQAVNHSLLTNGAATANAVQQLTNYVTQAGYDGVALDLENVAGGDRAALTAFTGRVSAAMHDRGKTMAMALAGKSTDVTTGWAGAYDYAALAPALDLAIIMAYAYTVSSSAPGSTAPAGWVDGVAAFATSQIPGAKVLLGVAFYGYDWDTTTGGSAAALRHPDAAALAAKYNATIGLDPGTRSATFTYSANACRHVVWLENAAAVQAKLAIASAKGARGAAAWRLGQEDPAVWPVVDAWKR